MQFRIVSVCGALVVFAVVAMSGEEPVPQNGSNVTYDRDKGCATISIAIENNRLRWRDVICGIAEAKGFDAETLVGVLPDGTAKIKKFRTQLLFSALNMSFAILSYSSDASSKKPAAQP